MKARSKTVTCCAISLALALTFSSPVSAQGMGGPAVPATGQEMIKTLGENEKVRVVDVVSHPGDTVPTATHPMRVIYVIRGGTLERTFADGTKEARTLKTGGTEIITESRAYSVKNTGKTTVHLIEVILK